MYAKFENEVLVLAPKYLIIGETHVWNAPVSEYISQGWYPMVYTDAPVTEEGYHAEYHWEQNGDEIVQVWIVVEDEPSADEIMEILMGESQ